MYIEELILDGFKSYATRTVISGFDPKFNAITGLNGSGKSNILDAICFVLGISNLTHVRATNLQELVYKQGQAGITKASVTIVFNNEDPTTSPVGYDQHQQICVTRQVVVGGRNKYLINGHTAQVSQVHNLFHSVQLNVNNPHFLIMQGRITKVLNMKPLEILAMIEEAAGTRMYETKKLNALQTMEKKNKKVEEITQILVNDITPTLEKLRQEKVHYLKWSANQSELERLDRFCIAYEFHHAEQQLTQTEDAIQRHKQELEENTQQIEKLEEELRQLEAKKTTLQTRKKQQVSQECLTLKSEQDQIGKEFVQLDTKYQNQQKLVQEEDAKLAKVQRQIHELTGLVDTQQVKLQSEKTKLEELLSEKHTLQTEFDRTQQQLQALSAGMSTADAAASSSDLLAQAERSLHQAKTTIQQTELKQQHLQSSVAQKQEELLRMGNSCEKDQAKLARLQTQVSKLATEQSKVAFNPTSFNQLETQQLELETKCRNLQTELDELYAKVSSSALSFKYKPIAGVTPAQVKGLIAQLIQVKDPTATSVALDTVAGGKLFHVVVDSEKTAKQILKSGNLQKRTTFVPLNRISRRTIPSAKIAKAQSYEQTPGQITAAMDLLEFDQSIAAAVEYAFGSAFVCESDDLAKQVTFDPSIRVRSVTLAGDSFDPAGTLTGGSSSSSQGSILLRLHQLTVTSKDLERHQRELQSVNGQIEQLQSCRSAYHHLQQEMEMKHTEIRLLKDRIEQSSVGILTQQIQSIESELRANRELIETKQQEVLSLGDKRENLQAQIQQMKANREETTSKYEARLDDLKEQVARATVKVQVQQEVVDVIELEDQENQTERQTLEDQLTAAAATKVTLKKELEQMAQATTAAKAQHSRLTKELDALQAKVSAYNTELQQLENERKQAEESIRQLRKSVKENHHGFQTGIKAVELYRKKTASLLASSPWIEQERQFFGQPQTDYCFASRDCAAIQAQVRTLQVEQDQLNHHINKKVMGMIEKAESEYQGLMKKKQIIENDKCKIQSVIKELDAKKKEALESTWQKVNVDFGKVFSTLLPGTQAKLEPPTPDDDFLDGLQVKVAFGDTWKESLTELSGGQRSLLALSLILALLLFKPAPMYILDEVDAALDLSHTQNIGQMIKRHFSHAQFLVVSLKEGMFNNANVVFRTKFIDGVSTVTRTLGEGQTQTKKTA